MLRIMLGCGQPRDADAIARSLLTVAGKRFTNRRAPTPRHPCCGTLIGAARHGQPQQPCWTAAPERTLFVMCKPFSPTYRPSSKLHAPGVADSDRPAGLPAGARVRQQPARPPARRANRDSLRMVQAEAALALGDAGGALRELKACASRWPDSALVWNLVTRALALQARARPATGLG